MRSSRYFGTRCQLRAPNQTLTPHSDRRTCAISSVATPARRIDADCPRTNVAGDPTIRSSPQLDPSVAPASQIRSAPRLEPSPVFRYSSRDFLVCGSSAFTTAALAGFTYRIYRFLRCADSRVKCRDVPPYRCATLAWLCGISKRLERTGTSVQLEPLYRCTNTFIGWQAKSPCRFGSAALPSLGLSALENGTTISLRPRPVSSYHPPRNVRRKQGRQRSIPP